MCAIDLLLQGYPFDANKRPNVERTRQTLSNNIMAFGILAIMVSLIGSTPSPGTA